jgi:hypothetical protein
MGNVIDIARMVTFSGAIPQSIPINTQKNSLSNKIYQNLLDKKHA